MAYYFDHKRTKVDDPAASVDTTPMLVGVYFVILLGLIATIAVSFMHMGDNAIFLHMAISTVQVCLVGYFWMHLAKSDSLTWLTALSGLFFMMILFALPLADYLTRHRGGL